MATLEKIRSKGGLLVLVIGLALLAFIIGDFLNSGVTYFNSSRENVAEIAGEDINIREFQEAIDQTTEVYKIEFGQENLGEEFLSQIRNMVWQNLVNDKLIQAEAKKIGLTVSKEELSDRLIGSNIHPLIQQRAIFRGANGQFDRVALIEFLNSLDQEAYSADMYQQIQVAKNYWLYWEKAVKNSILQDKYNALIGHSVVANSIDARSAFDANQKMYDFEYIQQPYYAVPDSVVSVSNSEIKDRYNKDKEQYKQEASRSVNYVSFELKPLPEDYVQVEEWMNKASEEFRTTDDVVDFIKANSDVLYDGSNYSERTVPVLLKDFAFSGKEGDFFGPVFQNDTHTMARIMQAGIMRPDSVKLRHIVLAPTDEARADSLVRVLNTDRNADFAELARQFSGVETAANGGELGWLTDGLKGVDKDFFQAFDKKVDEVFMIKKPQGIQIIQVMEKTRNIPKVKLAILERKVTPSSRSQAKIYNEAKQFAAVAKDVNTFQEQADERGLIVRSANNLDANAERIASVPQSRQVVRWAYEASLNNVSDVFDADDEFIVAVLTEVNKKGYAPLEKVSPIIKATLIKEKKGDYMVKDIQSKSASTINDLAGKMNLEVKDANQVAFATNQFGTAGTEPFVVGKGISTPLRQLSAPIKGNAGVYVVLPVNVTENSANEFNAEREVELLSSNYMYSFPYAIIQDIRDNAKIVDNRANFY